MQHNPVFKIIQEYREKLYKQAEHLRTIENITDLESAERYLDKNIINNSFHSGVMAGKQMTLEKLCAVLSHAIEPTLNPHLTMDSAPHAWSLFWKARHKGMH